MRIIIIDDELLIIKSISAVLNNAGHEVVGIAGTVARAIELIDAVQSDLALVDVNLQGASSDAVVALLETKGIDVLIISGYDQRQVPEQMRNKKLLQKPLDPEKLIAVIANLHG